MNIIWVADFTTKDRPGGAQETNNLMVIHGRKMWHNIKYMTPDDFSTLELERADLVIVNNILKFHPSHRKWIIENVPYVKYDHDHNTAKSIVNFPKLFLSAKLNIFLSPLHLQEVSKIVKYKIPNAKVVPSPINTDLFKITNKDKIKDSVFMCGNLAPFKGIKNVISYLKKHKEKSLFIAGWNEDKAKELISMKNVTFLGFIEHKKLPEVYNRYESFIHLTSSEEACGRTVLEAYLCGCRLIVNERVGVMSYKWDWKNYDEIKEKVNSQKQFWKLIEKI